MVLLKYTGRLLLAPSYATDHDIHCCECEECWRKDEKGQFVECPYMAPQFCFLCNDKSILCLLLNRDIKPESEEGSGRISGTVKFWACNKHLNDQTLLKILDKGIPSGTARSKSKLISFVRKQMET